MDTLKKNDWIKYLSFTLTEKKPKKALKITKNFGKQLKSTWE